MLFCICSSKSSFLTGTLLIPPLNLPYPCPYQYDLTITYDYEQYQWAVYLEYINSQGITK
jgi:hypothetical protein